MRIFIKKKEDVYVISKSGFVNPLLLWIRFGFISDKGKFALI